MLGIGVVDGVGALMSSKAATTKMEVRQAASETTTKTEEPVSEAITTKMDKPREMKEPANKAAIMRVTTVDLKKC